MRCSSSDQKSASPDPSDHDESNEHEQQREQSPDHRVTSRPLAEAVGDESMM